MCIYIVIPICCNAYGHASCRCCNDNLLCIDLLLHVVSYIVDEETRQRSKSITRFMAGQGDEGDAQKVRAVIVEDREKYIRTLEELAAERQRIIDLTEEARNARDSM